MTDVRWKEAGRKEGMRKGLVYYSPHLNMSRNHHYCIRSTYHFLLTGRPQLVASQAGGVSRARPAHPLHRAGGAEEGLRGAGGQLRQQDRSLRHIQGQEEKEENLSGKTAN